MQTDKKDPWIHISTAIEQMETMLATFAPAMSEYYKALVASGCPHELAVDLVRDWHTMWWENQFHGDQYAK